MAQTLRVNYSCEGYWSVETNQTVKGNTKTWGGIIWTCFNDRFSEGFLGSTSIIGFYVAIGYLVGNALRTILIYGSERIPIYDIPDPDKILNLTNCIAIHRMEQNLKK